MTVTTNTWRNQQSNAEKWVEALARAQRNYGYTGTLEEQYASLRDRYVRGYVTLEEFEEGVVQLLDRGL